MKQKMLQNKLSYKNCIGFQNKQLKIYTIEVNNFKIYNRKIVWEKVVFF
jgi:hypothetical protein